MKTRIIQYLLTLFMLGAFHNFYGQTVEKITMCEEVVDREPVNEKSTFAEGEVAVCWLKIVDAPVGDSISVEWYLKDELMYTNRLALKYASMRTYANKTLYQAGNWRVVVKSDNGVALASKEIVAAK